MSVLIKGMEMPTSCYACDMLELSGVVGCNHAYDTKNSDWGRALDCPLVPVPPHGRLIDADALIKELAIDDGDDNSGASLLMAVFLEVLKAAPTIIPAEEGE